MSSRLHALKSWASHLQNAFVRDQNHLCNELIELSSLSTKQNNATQNVWNKRLLFCLETKKTAKTFCKCFCFSKTSSSWKRFRSVFVWKNKQYLKLPHFGKYLRLPNFGKYLKLPHFGKYLKLPHFGKYLKLPYKVKCFFEISTTCHHFWLFHKCNFHKVSYSNGWNEVSSLMSKPFANDICKLLSH